MVDDLAIRMGLEMWVIWKVFPECQMVINFSVDAENEGFVIVDERLSSSVYRGKAQRLV